MIVISDAPAGTVARDDAIITVRIPMRFVRRGGRKAVIAPHGAGVEPYDFASQVRVDNTMVKALARAFRWQGLLERGDYGSFEELAKGEKINPSYLSRILRLTLLAPDIVEAVLDGRQTTDVTLGSLMRPLPNEWNRQREMLDV